MIVKAIYNKQHRDITIGKMYPIIFQKVTDNIEDKEIKIVDDFGSLSIYNFQDFKVYREDTKNYDFIENDLVYQLVNYPSFLENYYNDEKQAVDKLKESVVNILREELSEDELLKLIVSDEYSEDEKINFIKAITNKLSNLTAEEIAKYFIKKPDIEEDLLTYLCDLLMHFKNQSVYVLFLMYLSDSLIKNSSTENKIIEFFDSYY